MLGKLFQLLFHSCHQKGTKEKCLHCQIFLVKYSFDICRTLAQIKAATIEERTPKKPKVYELNPQHWRPVDCKKESFDPPQFIPENSHIVFHMRQTTYLSTFLHFVPIDLLKQVWNNHSWKYCSDRSVINGGVFDVSLLYKLLAIKIRIQSLHNVPPSNTKNYRPLLEAINEARSHFSSLEMDGNSCIPGRDIITYLLGHFLFHSDYFDLISRQFQSVIKHLGEHVSGDEILDHFTGNSGHIRLNKNKPAKIGLLHYELAVKVDDHHAYLLDMKMSKVNKQVGESEIMAEIVSRWARVITSINKNHPNILTSLAFDSHYSDKATRDALINLKQPFVGAVQNGRFGPIVKQLESKVKKPGDWSAMVNNFTNELMVVAHDKEDEIGKKICFGNFLERKPNKAQSKHWIPLYDDYMHMFNGCDIYNKQIKGCMWPHKKGGRSQPGDKGKQDDFCFTSILMNTFVATREMNQDTANPLDFRNLGLKLSDELFEFACSYKQ